MKLLIDKPSSVTQVLFCWQIEVVSGGLRQNIPSHVFDAKFASFDDNDDGTGDVDDDGGDDDDGDDDDE